VTFLSHFLAGNETDLSEVELHGDLRPPSKRRRLVLGCFGALAAVLIIVLAVVLTTKSSANHKPSGDEIWKELRLPADIQPVHYSVHLTPDLSDFSYTGTAEIDVKV